VQHGVEGAIGEHFGRALTQGGHYQFTPGWHRVGVPRGQIVEDHDGVSGRHEVGGDDTTYVASAAGNQ
jgi:hypothetical protein